jgi:hypothetical protein
MTHAQPQITRRQAGITAGGQDITGNARKRSQIQVPRSRAPAERPEAAGYGTFMYIYETGLRTAVEIVLLLAVVSGCLYVAGSLLGMRSPGHFTIFVVGALAELRLFTGVDNADILLCMLIMISVFCSCSEFRGPYWIWGHEQQALLSGAAIFCVSSVGLHQYKPNYPGYGDGSFWHRIIFVISVIGIALGLSVMYAALTSNAYFRYWYSTDTIMQTLRAQSDALVGALTPPVDHGKIDWRAKKLAVA